MKTIKMLFSSTFSFILGAILVLTIGVSAAVLILPADTIRFSSNKTDKDNVKDAVDELYDMALSYCPNNKICKKYLRTAIVSQSLGVADNSEGNEFFSSSAVEQGNYGVYELGSTVNNKYPVYFYRGDDSVNNNVYFAGYCWSIIRTTELGGTRMIYKGLGVESYDDYILEENQYDIVTNTGNFQFDIVNKEWVATFEDSDSNHEISFRVPIGEYYRLQINGSIGGENLTVDGSGAVYRNNNQWTGFSGGNQSDPNVLTYLGALDENIIIKVTYQSSNISKSNPVTLKIKMLDYRVNRLNENDYRVLNNTDGEFEFNPQDKSWDYTVYDEVEDGPNLIFNLPDGDYRLAFSGTTGDKDISTSGGTFYIYRDGSQIYSNGGKNGYPISGYIELKDVKDTDEFKVYFVGSATEEQPINIKFRAVQLDKNYYNGVTCSDTSNGIFMYEKEVGNHQNNLYSYTPLAGYTGKWEFEYNTNYNSYLYNGYMYGNITFKDEGINLEDTDSIGISSQNFVYDLEENEWKSMMNVHSSSGTITFKVADPGDYILRIKTDTEKNGDKALVYKNSELLGNTSGYSGVISEDIKLDNLKITDVIKVVYKKDAAISKGEDNVVFSILNEDEEKIPRSEYVSVTVDKPPKLYYTYADSYDFDTKTGYFTLKNNDGSPVKSCDYTSCYETLKGKYITKSSYSINSDVDKYSELSIIYKISSNSSATKLEYNSIKAVSQETDHNTNSSNLKNVLEAWYKGAIVDANNNYESKIEDSIYCNDRLDVTSIYKNEFAVEDNNLYFNSKLKSRRYTPDTICSQEADRFTVSKDHGNGELTYPVGFVTVDDLQMGGRNYDSSMDDYLNGFYWTGSPGVSFNTNSGQYLVYYQKYGAYFPTSNVYVRPVISLKADVGYIKGNGSKDNPYIIEE